MKKQALISSSFALGIIALIIMMLFSTNPDRVGPTGVTVFFFLLFGLFFVIIDFIWRLTARNKRQPKYNLYFIAVLAGLPSVLLALQSLQQLQIKDVGIVCLLAAMIIFYLSKRQ